MTEFSRRIFLSATPVLATAVWRLAPGQRAASLVDSRFPSQADEVVRAVVGAAHGNLPRLRELIDRRPALARASWDWGFGDWESALGAASHVGNHAIATWLIEKGARPSIFSAAMLGQLVVVRAFVEAQPGIQRTKGPHGITLLAHARAGGPAAAAVLEYLTSLGDADLPLQAAPLSTTERDSLLGTYVFGESPADRFDVGLMRERLGILRPGGSQRGLIHRGGLEFSPVGADAVRITFSVATTETTLTVLDPDPVVVARAAARRLARPGRRP